MSYRTNCLSLHLKTGLTKGWQNDIKAPIQIFKGTELFAKIYSLGTAGTIWKSGLNFMHKSNSKTKRRESWNSSFHIFKTKYLSFHY